MAHTVQDLSDANYIQSVREHARWQDPCEFAEQDGLILVAGANAFPIAYRNCAVRVDRRLAPKDALARAREFFGARRRGFTLITRDSRDEDLAAFSTTAGLKPVGEIPCMLIETPLAEPRVPSDIRIDRFREERHVQDAVAVNAEAYEAIKLPAREARAYFGRPKELLSERVEGFVAYRDARPVSTALTIFSGESAGVYWVGTAESARRRGLGEICTRLATNAGFERGAKVVTLQASPYGEPIYKQLGYRTYDRTRRFMELPPK
jgi:hypothetical protein